MFSLVSPEAALAEVFWKFFFADTILSSWRLAVSSSDSFVFSSFFLCCFLLTDFHRTQKRQTPLWGWGGNASEPPCPAGLEWRNRRLTGCCSFSGVLIAATADRCTRDLWLGVWSSHYVQLGRLSTVGLSGNMVWQVMLNGVGNYSQWVCWSRSLCWPVLMLFPSSGAWLVKFDIDMFGMWCCIATCKDSMQSPSFWPLPHTTNWTVL